MAVGERTEDLRAPSDTASTSTPLGRVPALDALRGLAIVAVLSFHLHDGQDRPLVDGGFLGVDAFFVLSGFLITTLLVDEHRRMGSIRIRSFWRRRFARVAPLAWLVIALAALTAVRPVAGFHPPSRHGFVAAGTFAGNWIPVFGANGLYQLQYLWSIAVEVQFYLVWPLVVIVILRRTTADGVAVAAVGLAILVALTRPTAFATTDYFFHTGLRADGLLLGAALGASRHRWQHRVGPVVGAALVVVGAVVATAMIALAVDGRSSVPTWQLPLFELGVVALIAGCVAAPTTLPARFLAWRPLVALGFVSYALYLVHLPVFDLVEVRLPIGDRTGLRIVVEVALALAAAVVAHRLVERPANRWLRGGRPAASSEADPGSSVSLGSGRSHAPRTWRW